MDFNGIYDTTTENAVIGNILNNPSLLLEDEVKLGVQDFYNRRNKIVFSMALDLVMQGVQHITPQELEVHIMRYEEQYEAFKKGGGVDALLNFVESQPSSDYQNYKILVERLKKYSTLRDLQAAGISIARFYNDDLFSDNTDFEELTVQDILRAVKSDINDIEERVVNKNEAKGQSAATGLRELVEQYKLTPEVGKQLDGEIYNYAVRGGRYGKYYLCSAPSSHGKTRKMIGHACGLAFPYLDDNERIVMRSEYFPLLYIATEQDASEIQTMILAYVSGVNENNILMGAYTEEQGRRIEIALKIIELMKDNFIIEYMPDPSLGLIRTKILQYIYKKNVHFVFYDYIFSSPGLLTEMQGARIREDVLLMLLSNTLKEIAASYQVFLMSATQVSGDFDKPSFRNSNMLRGSKAIADKIDVGSIFMRLHPNEQTLVQPTIDALAATVAPNQVTDIYKNRRGELTAIKIFSYFDYGTCRTTDLFATDLDYKLISNYSILKEEVQLLDTFAELERRVAHE